MGDNAVYNDPPERDAITSCSCRHARMLREGWKSSDCGLLSGVARTGFNKSRHIGCRIERVGIGDGINSIARHDL